MRPIWARIRTARRSWRWAASLAVIVVAALQPPAPALPDTETPSLSGARTIRTTPFTGTATSMRDGEGSAFVPNDPGHPNKRGTDSLWLVDDRADSLYEVDPHSGAVKSRIARADLAATRRFGCTARRKGACAAGKQRTWELEGMAYDQAGDSLYAFSNTCCGGSGLPTAFRLTRRAGGSFFPRSFQPLPPGADYSAAAWNPGDGLLYVGKAKDLRTYHYVTNSSGPAFRVPDLTGILSMTFSNGDLFVVNSSEQLLRVDWASRTLRAGWTFDLTPFDVRDSRGVEVIADPATGNEQFYVLDGYDLRSTGDPLRYAVFVFDVCCAS